MRVISGKFKSRQLVSFKADHIRPTTDRVKESLFNKLMGVLEGSRVLDLFSGTGNLAIECISREAAHVDLVESHKQSLQIIRKNLQSLQIDSNHTVHPVDVFKYLRDYQGAPYDVILADPPFTRAWAHEICELVGVSSARLLAPKGLFVIEASSQERVDEAYPGLERLDQRAFGDKALHFWRST